MDEKPEQPAGGSPDSSGAALPDRVVARHRGEPAKVAVAEGPRLRVAVEAPNDLGCRVPSRLERGLRQAGQPIERYQIADDEDFRAARWSVRGSKDVIPICHGRVIR